MKRRWFYALLSAGIIIIAVVFVAITDSETLLQTYEANRAVFTEAANELFDLLDREEIRTGEALLLSEFVEDDASYARLRKNVALSRALKRLYEKCGVIAVEPVEKNVILFSCGACYQSVSGIVKTRNAPHLKDYWEGTGYDRGMSYGKIDADTHFFDVGL